MSTIHHNFAESRFDVYDDGAKTGFVQYEMRDGRMCFLLTVLTLRLRSAGYTASVLGEVLDGLFHRRMEILPYCPVVREFISHHPEYLDLVPHNQLHHFKLSTGRDPSPADSPAAPDAVHETP